MPTAPKGERRKRLGVSEKQDRRQLSEARRPRRRARERLPEQVQTAGFNAKVVPA
jgi:hypothetical protein